jgi:hypothetical protein
MLIINNVVKKGEAKIGHDSPLRIRKRRTKRGYLLIKHPNIA